MSCQKFESTFPACKTYTIIEPDSTLLTSTGSGSVDKSLDESGSTVIPTDTGELQVPFTVPKASVNYRFEYLYVDALGITNPGDVEPVVSAQSLYGFTVDLAGIPLATGYILRWRVVVVEIDLVPSVVDSPESLRLPLVPSVRSFIATFVNPRSNTNYGFIELRVENLIDDPATQRLILPQVVAKSNTNFRVELSASPDSENYFLVARTP